MFLGVFVILAFAACVGLAVDALVAGPQSRPTEHPGLDACVMADSTRMVPEAWLIETRAQRDSLYGEMWRWRDSVTHLKGWVR
jgi:hypothetical protein